jgi:hypothetical protein
MMTRSENNSLTTQTRYDFSDAADEGRPSVANRNLFVYIGRFTFDSILME